MDYKDKLELLRQMAMADGILTDNEKLTFRQNIPMSDDEAATLFKSIETELESIQSETEVIDWKQKNGLNFEKYIVERFPINFKIKNWTGDKYINGKYDKHNLDPDLIVDIETPKQICTIAIECKFRMGFAGEWVFVAKDYQLERYRKYQAENNTPVFIAIGVGGSGANPEHLFMVPVNALKFSGAKHEYLNRFKLNEKKKFFFFIKNKTFKYK